MEHLDHPSPHFNDTKMARFALRASSSLLRGGGGLIGPFCTIQDCSPSRVLINKSVSQSVSHTASKRGIN